MDARRSLRVEPMRTELDRQGPDSGPSYRSEIFYSSPTQERIARAYVAQLTKAKVFG